MTLANEQIEKKIQILVTQRANILTRIEQAKSEIKNLENEHWIVVGQIKQLKELIDEQQEEQKE